MISHELDTTRKEPGDVHAGSYFRKHPELFGVRLIALLRVRPLSHRSPRAILQYPNYFEAKLFGRNSHV